MTARERQISIGLATLAIGVLVVVVAAELQPKPVKPVWNDPVPYIPATKNSGYGIGETPGYGTLTPTEAGRLSGAASQYGVSPQEVEQLRVQTMHQAMYPEDAVGGRNYRESQREQSRKASGFYDSQPRR